jgi:hypothetical protein
VTLSFGFSIQVVSNLNDNFIRCQVYLYDGFILKIFPAVRQKEFYHRILGSEAFMLCFSRKCKKVALSQIV